MPSRKSSADANNNGIPQRPKGRPRGFRRDRDCRTCKARNVKCDLNRPSCGICVAQGIACQGYATTVRWAVQASHQHVPAGALSPQQHKLTATATATTTPCLKKSSTSPVEQKLSAIPTPVGSAPIQVPPPDQQAQWLPAAEENPDDSNWTTHYLKYFEFFTKQFDIARQTARRERRCKTTTTTSSCSSSAATTTNTTTTSPSSQDQQSSSPPSTPVVDRALTGVWSLLWQRISGQVVRGDYQSNVDLLSYHAAALAELNEAIKAGDILAIYGIVTLSFLDVYEGPFIDCQWHMHGANALIKLHCDGPAALEELCGELAGLREAISLLSWYDTMGFYFEQNRRNALVFDDWVREAMRDEFFQLVGCPRDTYMVYAEVVKARTLRRGPGGMIKLGDKQGTKLAMLAIQQMMRASRGGVAGASEDHIVVLADSFRYAAALIATETAHAGGEVGGPDAESADTMARLGDLVCDQVEAGVPITSGRYRHLACQVTILGNHARTPRHSRVVDDYWTRCDRLTRPIYPMGREISTQARAHWTRILGTSSTGSVSVSGSPSEASPAGPA